MLPCWQAQTEHNGHVNLVQELRTYITTNIKHLHVLYNDKQKKDLVLTKW